jgi:hypothetical protein
MGFMENSISHNKTINIKTASGVAMLDTPVQIQTQKLSNIWSVYYLDVRPSKGFQDLLVPTEGSLSEACIGSLSSYLSKETFEGLATNTMRGYQLPVTAARLSQICFTTFI